MTPQQWDRLVSTPLKVGEKRRPNDSDRVVTDTQSPYLVAKINDYMNDAPAYAELFADAVRRRQAYHMLLLAAGLVAVSQPVPGTVQRTDGAFALVSAEKLSALRSTLISLGLDLDAIAAEAAAPDPKGATDGQ